MENQNESYSFLLEEISEDFDEEEEDSIKYVFVNKEENVQNNKFSLPISQAKALELYNMAGTEELEMNNEVRIFPPPTVLTTSEENVELQLNEHFI